MLGNPTIQLPMVATVGVWFERGHQLEQGDAHLGKKHLLMQSPAYPRSAHKLLKPSPLHNSMHIL